MMVVMADARPVITRNTPAEHRSEPHTLGHSRAGQGVIECFQGVPRLEKIVSSFAQSEYQDHMNKIHRAKAAASGRRNAAAEVGSSRMTVFAASEESGGDDAAISERGRQWRRENQAAIESYNE